MQEKKIPGFKWGSLRRYLGWDLQDDKPDYRNKKKIGREGRREGEKEGKRGQK